MASSLVFSYVERHPLVAVTTSLVTVLSLYVVYQAFLHPLAKYPGPFLAKVTDLWQVNQFVTLYQPYNLTRLHEKYGPIVRYGPDKLSITDEQAMPLLYQKGGKTFPKTEFYDAYGAANNPNVFGMRDEARHAVRRRHMSHSFSMSYIKEFEGFLDINIAILKQRIAAYASSGQAFDLQRLIKHYVVDASGEIAFGQPFGVQETDDDARVPPVIDHSLLAAVTGAWPFMTMTLKKWLPLVPIQKLRRLFEGRKACVDLASRSVARRMSVLQAYRETGQLPPGERKDLLSNLILARDPDTGSFLTQADLETEAFGFIIAGTHTTSATTSLLFYHLLHSPENLSRCVAEIDSNLPKLEEGHAAYPVMVAESSAPFLKQCVKENFRITPVFTMPLARRVVDPAGVTIGDYHFPQGTSLAVCNHAFHHNPEVWGLDHNIFDPSRWDDKTINDKARYLMHFGLGPRQCIGKTLATTNIYKLTTTLLREFTFELADEQERILVNEGAFVGKLPKMISVGISDLKEPLMITARARS